VLQNNNTNILHEVDISQGHKQRGLRPKLSNNYFRMLIRYNICTALMHILFGVI